MKTRTLYLLALLVIFLTPFLKAQKTSLGDTLGAFNAGNLTPTPDRGLAGIEFAEGHFWVTGADPDDLWQHKLYKISADGQTLVDYWEYGIGFASWKDMAYDGEYLYVADVDTIRQIDMETGQETGVKIPAPEYYTSGLAYDPATDHFWSSGDGNIIYEIDRDGNIVNSISFVPDLPSTGLAWDVWSEGGPYLWVWSMKYTPSDVRPKAYQVFPESGELTEVTFEGELMNPQAPYAADYALGATITDELIPGKVTFVGLHGSSYQQYNDQLDWAVFYDLDPEGTGVPGPEISITPESIQNNLLPGDSVDVPVYISNQSDQYNLNWLATLEYPGMNDTTGTPGEVLLSFDASALTSPNTNNRLWAVAYTGDYIYVGSRTNFDDQFQLYKIEKDGSAIVETYNFYDFTTGWRALASDGRYIYGVRQYQINKFDPIGDSLVETYPLTGFAPRAMAYDPQQELFYLGGLTGAVKVVNKQDEEINFYVTPYPISGLSWDRWSPGGPYLWAYYYSQDSVIKATRLNPSTGGPTGFEFEGINLSGDPNDPDIPAGIAITPDWQQNQLVAVALHESNSQPGNGNDKVVVYDLATTPPPDWIELLPPSFGTTEQLDSDTMFVRLRAIMEDTLMTAQIVINSNDVINPGVTIPVNFRMMPEIFTGIEADNVRESNMIDRVYPNPATDQFTMQMNEITNPANIQVFNYAGMLIDSRTINSPGNIRFDVSGWPSGFYQVVIRSQNQIDHRKLIVQ